MGRDHPAPEDSQRRRNLRRKGGGAPVALRRPRPRRVGAPIEVFVRPGDVEAQGALGPGAPMTDYREADLSRLKTVSITRRVSKVNPSLLARAPGSDASFRAFR